MRSPRPKDVKLIARAVILEGQHGQGGAGAPPAVSLSETDIALLREALSLLSVNAELRAEFPPPGSHPADDQAKADYTDALASMLRPGARVSVTPSPIHFQRRIN